MTIIIDGVNRGEAAKVTDKRLSQQTALKEFLQRASTIQYGVDIYSSANDDVNDSIGFIVDFSKVTNPQSFKFRWDMSSAW